MIDYYGYILHRTRLARVEVSDAEGLLRAFPTWDAALRWVEDREEKPAGTARLSALWKEART
jgi:hypothetical protein